MPNIHAGLRRAEDFMKAQKTKNFSNKNKEHTLIAGAIVKLVERQDLGGMAASMSMMMMRQLKAMNSSMDRREQQERKQERRERKKRKICKKHRAMKKAKKNAKKDMLAGLNDHGGKAGQDSSSSSSSSSSDSDSSNTVTAIAAVTLTRVVIMVMEVGGVEETWRSGQIIKINNYSTSLSSSLLAPSLPSTSLS
jgi:hypothetical protein